MTASTDCVPGIKCTLTADCTMAANHVSPCHNDGKPCATCGVESWQAYLRFYCDNMRHLVCLPYTVANLHTMAKALGIKRCWFHRHKKHPHYDIPLRRIAEIQSKVTVVSTRDMARIMRGEDPFNGAA